MVEIPTTLYNPSQEPHRATGASPSILLRVNPIARVSHLKGVKRILPRRRDTTR